MPEIPYQHQLKMLEWAKYLAYSKRDSEMYDPNARDEAEHKFSQYFGSPYDFQEQERRQKGGEIDWMFPIWGDHDWNLRSNSYLDRYFWL